MPATGGGVIADISTDGGNIGKFIIGEENLIWAYRNNIEQPANSIAGVGHPPLSLWKSGQFEPFSFEVSLFAWGPNAPEGFAKSADELIATCEKLAKACLPKPGDIGLHKQPDRIIVKVGSWFKIVGLPETCTVKFMGPFAGPMKDKPMSATILIGLKPASKAATNDSGDKWNVDNTWGLASMY